MNRLRVRRHSVEHDNVDRWLVSYADYMTLLFALFVVLYAMAIVHDKPFESVTESLGKVFQADNEETKNKGQGEGLLPVNTPQTNKILYGNGILEVPGSELVEGEKRLSNIDNQVVGTALESLETELHTALFDIVESGYAKLQIDGDWLEIELNSGLLFPSGSSSPTKQASAVLTTISDVLVDVNNFLRVRGYTDDQTIENEIFASNWELSVFRATAILRLLEEQKIAPARMAIEGYGQYYPIANNNTAQGRAQNRRVVIAISKYGLAQPKQKNNSTVTVKEVAEIKKITDTDKAALEKEKNKIKIIQLENGGLRITTRDEEEPTQ